MRRRNSSVVRFARPGRTPIDTTQSDSSVLDESVSGHESRHHPSRSVDEQELFPGGEDMVLETTDPSRFGAVYLALQVSETSHIPPGALAPPVSQREHHHTRSADPSQPLPMGNQQTSQSRPPQIPDVTSAQDSEHHDKSAQVHNQPARDSPIRQSAMYDKSPISHGRGQESGGTRGTSGVPTDEDANFTPSRLTRAQNIVPGSAPYDPVNHGHASPRHMGADAQTLRRPADPQGAPHGYKQYDESMPGQYAPSEKPGIHPARRSSLAPQHRLNSGYRYPNQATDGRPSDATLAGSDLLKNFSDDIANQDRYTTARQPPFTGNRPRAHSAGSDTEMRRQDTSAIEKMEQAYVTEEPYVVKGGVFSQLLRLTGRSATLRKRQSSAWGGTGMDSRAASTVGGDIPTMQSLGLQRRGSAVTVAGEGEEFDDLDPRVTGQKKKVVHRRKSLSDLFFGQDEQAAAEGIGGKKYRRRASVRFHVADILTRQRFILKLASALMIFGAPSHRIESQLTATALVLEVDAQFLHLPSIVLASFGDIDTRTSEMHFVKAQGHLDLGKLHKVHAIYKAVVHDEYDAAEGTKRIQALLKSPLIYNVWIRILMAFFSSGLVCPMAYGGSLLDGLASGMLGVLLAFLQLHVASKNALYSNIFEISIATFISFAAKGLSVTGLFCYQAIVSAGVTLILPGYTILCGSLELASKNIVAGSVRMVYAIIYSLFLGFGITIGSDIFYVIDRPARAAANKAAAAASTYLTVTGTFIPGQILVNALNATYADAIGFLPFNGTVSFSNATVDAATTALKAGSVICPRPPGLPWYLQGMPRAYLVPIVPVFSVLIALWNFQPLRSRQLPVMVVISCVGYVANEVANTYIFDRSDVVTAIGAFVIGVLGNIYSRVFGGTAFTSMVPGVLFLTPSGIAAAGGLAMTTTQSHAESYNQGLIIGFRMVQVAIGITVGLFGSGLLIYSFGRKKGSALFAF